MASYLAVHRSVSTLMPVRYMRTKISAVWLTLSSIWRSEKRETFRIYLMWTLRHRRWAPIQTLVSTNIVQISRNLVTRCASCVDLYLAMRICVSSSFTHHIISDTTFDETVYFIDLPNVEEDTLITGFTILRDFADGALLGADSIDTERGVILSEERAWDSVEWRIFLKQLEFLIPDHRLAHREPGGTKEVIQTAPRQRFVDFYTKYYVPERITVVAVGDVETDELEEYIEAKFEAMVQPENAGKDPAMGTVPKDIGFRAAVFTDEEIIEDEVWLTRFGPWTVEPDTEAYRIKQIPLDLAHNILTRRFGLLAKDEESPIKYGFASRGNVFNLLDWGDVVVYPVEGRWDDAGKRQR